MDCRSKPTQTHPRVWARAGAEPSLEEMLADPVVGMVMDSDAVTADEVRAVMQAANRRRVAGHRLGAMLAQGAPQGEVRRALCHQP